MPLVNALLANGWIKSLLVSFTIVTFGLAYPLYNASVSYPLEISTSGLALLYIVVLIHLTPTTVIFLVDRSIAHLVQKAWILFVYRTILLTFLLVSLLRQVQLEYPTSEIIGISSIPKYGLILIAIGLVTTISILGQRLFLRALIWLSPVALFFTVAFIYQSGLLYSAWQSQDVTTSHVKVADPSPPVFIIVLDGLGRDTVQTNGKVDLAKFPNLGALAQEGVWFTNATTNYNLSQLAMGAALTGDLFSEDTISQGRAGDFINQNSVYDTLDLEYNINLFGYYFSDCLNDTFTCYGTTYFTEKYPYLFTVTMVRRVLNILLPCSITDLLPTGLNKLMHFDCHADRNHWSDIQQFEAFIDNIEADKSSGQIHHFHSWITDYPYVFDENGNRHSLPANLTAFRNSSTQDLVRQNQSRQFMFADHLLGKFINKLKSEGIYDESIIIITADHGPIIVGGSAGTSEEEIINHKAWIPLFIRGPSITPGVSAVDYQHIDFRATLLDVLDMEPVEGLDGVSAFASQQSERDKVFYWVNHDLTVSKFIYDNHANEWHKDTKRFPLQNSE